MCIAQFHAKSFCSLQSTQRDAWLQKNLKSIHFHRSISTRDSSNPAFSDSARRSSNVHAALMSTMSQSVCGNCQGQQAAGRATGKLQNRMTGYLQYATASDIKRLPDSLTVNRLRLPGRWYRAC
jgi:hypothetical protein